MAEGVMGRQFYFLKASVLVLAVAIAGLTTGFNADRLATRFDRVHYSATVYADAQTHRVTHAFSHAVGGLIDWMNGR
jgi:hypothetical protein